MPGPSWIAVPSSCSDKPYLVKIMREHKPSIASHKRSIKPRCSLWSKEPLVEKSIFKVKKPRFEVWKLALSKPISTCVTVPSSPRSMA